jgi:hypothetical protein
VQKIAQTCHTTTEQLVYAVSSGSIGLSKEVLEEIVMNQRVAIMVFLVILLLIPALVLSASPNDEYDHYALLPVIRANLKPVGTWAMAYGYDADMRHDAVAVVESSEGGFVFGGRQEDPANLLKRDILITKINTSGTIVWQKLFDGIVDDSLVDMDRTTDGKLIVAGSAIGGTTESRDVWFAKLDDDGAIIWQKLFSAGSTRLYANDIQSTADGGLAAVGQANDGNDGLWIIKMNGDGNLQWQRQYADIYAGSTRIVEDGDGGYFIGGTWDWEWSGELDVHVQHLDGDGKIIWQKAFGEILGYDWFMAMDRAVGGGIFIAGLNVGESGSDLYFWLMKVNKDGSVQWHREIAGAWEMIDAIQALPDGGCLVTGNTADGNMWLLRLDAHGSAVWQRHYQGAEWDEPKDLLLISSGGYMLAGQTRSYGSGDVNAWLLKLDTVGNIADCSIDETLSPVLREFSLPVRTPAVTGKAYTGTLFAGDLSSSDGGATRTVICPKGQANGAPAIGEGWAGRSTLCRGS